MKTQGRSFGRKAKDALLRGLMYLCAGITCALLVFLIGYIFFRGIPNLSWQLISTQSSYRTNTIGILPNILNTLYIIIVSMVIVVPLGVCAAIYLTEYAKNKKVVRLIELRHGDPDRYPVHYLRPSGYAVLYPGARPEAGHSGRRPDSGGHGAAHHRPQHHRRA